MRSEVELNDYYSEEIIEKYSEEKMLKLMKLLLILFGMIIFIHEGIHKKKMF